MQLLRLAVRCDPILVVRSQRDGISIKTIMCTRKYCDEFFLETENCSKDFPDNLKKVFLYFYLKNSLLIIVSFHAVT
jgi:heat shock protein HslJ